MERELTEVYCGNGKGKTALAIGQSIREAVQGRSVIVIQFLKGCEKRSLDFLEEMDNLDFKIFRFEKRDCCYDQLTEEEKAEEKSNILNGLNFARKVVVTQECDFLLLDEILGLLGLTEKRDALPGNLSGGQQQRAAIARALAAKPAIILADEPTGNLDSATSHDVLGLLKMASKQFCQTLILITHDRDIAQLADRIVHIEDGRIIGGLEKGSDPDA